MNMLLLKIGIYMMTLLSHESGYKEYITIIGKTVDAKDGAYVRSRDNGKMYFLDGINYWDEKMLGKTIKVSGKLFIAYTEPQKPGEPIAQQRLGIKRTILKPKWELIR